MKALRLFMTTIVVLLSSCTITRTIEYNTYYKNNFCYNKFINGFWGNWDINAYGLMRVFLEGNTLYIYKGYEHPSEYIAKIVMYGFYIDDNKESRKKHIDENSPYVYSGTIEYYWDGDVPDSYLSMSRLADKKYLTQKNASCSIIINPYKTYPQTFNVFYGNKGFAISLSYKEFDTI